MKLYLVHILSINSMHTYVSNVLTVHTHIHVVMYLEKKNHTDIKLIQIGFLSHFKVSGL